MKWEYQYSYEEIEDYKINLFNIVGGRAETWT
jgi:hypothetical protein